MLKIAVRRIFLKAPQLDIASCLTSPTRNVSFDAMTSSVSETEVSCPATQQDMLVRYVKEWFDLQ